MPANRAVLFDIEAAKLSHASPHTRIEIDAARRSAASPECDVITIVEARPDKKRSPRKRQPAT